MTSILFRKNKQLWVEQVSLQQVAESFETPFYIYSMDAIKNNFNTYKAALSGQKHLICYSVKANSNIAVLQTLARLGSGFDIVSLGELERVLMAGGDPKKIVFSGVGKSRLEMRRALEVGIYCFNIESEAELSLLNKISADMRMAAPISIRVNPDIDVKTHPYIATGLKESKFGIDALRAEEIYLQAAKMEHVRIIGIDCHIGSQLTEITPFENALNCLIALIKDLKRHGIILEHIDLGGGLGVRYRDETPPSIKAFTQKLTQLVKERKETLILEPGRSIIANAGFLVTRVQFLKCNGSKRFAICDAAMNDMLRPSLYGSFMDIQPIFLRQNEPTHFYDIVGPICETGDFLGYGRELSILPGDLLCVCDAGAYSFSMSSNYNSRPRAPELMVSGKDVHVIRQRETIKDIVRGEHLISKMEQ